jgi:large subunit ribosomal protein L15
MRLNTLKPARGSKRPAKRVGRGMSAGQGQTAGRGIKGQTSRAGGYHKTGFEGGQMPLQRRLPKIGFISRSGHRTAEVRVHELARLAGETIDLAALKKARIVPAATERAKVIASGNLAAAVKLVGVAATPGARKIIEAAGGSIE